MNRIVKNLQRLTLCVLIAVSSVIFPGIVVSDDFSIDGVGEVRDDVRHVTALEAAEILDALPQSRCLMCAPVSSTTEAILRVRLR